MIDIQISKQVEVELVKKIENFGETHNDVLIRILGLPQTKKETVIFNPEVVKTKKILYSYVNSNMANEMCLISLGIIGGRANKNTVIITCEKIFGKWLNEKDWEINQSGQVRWKNTIAWARKRLVDEGHFKIMSKSGRGIWELSEIGCKKFYELYAKLKIKYDLPNL